MMSRLRFLILAVTALLVTLVSIPGFAASSSARSTKKNATASAGAHKHKKARKRVASLRKRTARPALKDVSTRTVRTRRVRHARHPRYLEHFSSSSYATDTTTGDATAAADAIVRQAALAALGNLKAP